MKKRTTSISISIAALIAMLSFPIAQAFVISGNGSLDIELTAFDNRTVGIVYINVTNNIARYVVWDTNGTRSIAPVNIDTNGDAGSRISIDAINNTHAAIGLIDMPVNNLDLFIQTRTGTAMLGRTAIDGNIGTISDVSIAVMGDTFAICDANQNDGNADYYVRFSSNGSIRVGESNVDALMTPELAGQNLVDCSPLNSSAFLYTFFDDDQNDAAYAIRDNTGAAIATGDSDTGVQETGQVAIAGLRNAQFVNAFYDRNSQDIAFNISQVSHTTVSNVLARTNAENTPGTDSRLAVAEVENDGTSAIVMVWQNSSDNTIRARTYTATGTAISDSILVSPTHGTQLLLDVVGSNSITGNGLCNGTFAVAYTNGSQETLIKTFYLNGQSWNGRCDKTVPSIDIKYPTAGMIFNSTTIFLNFTAYDNYGGYLGNCTYFTNTSGNMLNVSTIFNVETGISYNMSLANIEDGSYTYRVSCIDLSDNTNTSQTWPFVVNTHGPNIGSASWNVSFINQSQHARFNVTIADSANVSQAYLILRTPNGSSQQYSLTQTGSTFRFIETDTWNIGWYNITAVYANDSQNRWTNQTANTYSFQVVASLPTAFNLLSPLSSTNSTLLTPNLTWEQSYDANFSNYTILLDTDAGFGSPDFMYTRTSSNMPWYVTGALVADRTYYWKVIANDSFNNSRTSSSTFTYITRNDAPVVDLLVPADNAQHPHVNLTLIFYVTETNINTCTLYTNHTGIWKINTSAPVVAGFNTFILYNLTRNLTFNWNVQCNDTLDLSSFAPTNHSISILGPGAFQVNTTLTSQFVILNTPPNITTIALNASYDLLTGTTAPFTFTVLITDDNGAWEIDKVNATMYHFGNTTVLAANNDTNHYSTNCTFSAVSELSVNATCSFSPWFFANNGTWTVFIDAEDATLNHSNGSQNITIPALFALDVNTSSLEFGEQSALNITDDVAISVINLGNAGIDVTMYGYGASVDDGLSFLCPYGSITIANAHFSTSAGQPWSAMTPLSGIAASPVLVDLTVPKTNTNTSNQSKGVYWKLAIPPEAFGACNGTLTLSGVIGQ
jgi:hypothetical protein